MIEIEYNGWGYDLWGDSQWGSTDESGISTDYVIEKVDGVTESAGIGVFEF